MDAVALRAELKKHTWYHKIDLGDGVTTPGDERFVRQQQHAMLHLNKMDFAGKRVLDIGCRDGLYSFAAESSGAREVIGIDNDLSEGAVNLVIPHLRSSVRMHALNVYDLTPETFGKFDVVIFPGVLYHLRYPFWALKAIRQVLNIGGQLLTETAIWHSVENVSLQNMSLLWCPVGKQSPYEATSCTFFNVKGLVDTLTSLGCPTPTVSLLPDTPLSKDQLGGVYRGVFVSKFLGVDGDSDVMRYWEAQHEMHTVPKLS